MEKKPLKKVLKKKDIKLIKKLIKKPTVTPLPKSVLTENKQINTAEKEAEKRNELANKIEAMHEETTLKEGAKIASKPYLFQKGQSGNPNGRPKGRRSWTSIIREAMQKKIDPATGVSAEEQIINNIVEMAKKGHTKMIELLWNYIDGKPNQPMNLDVYNNELSPEERAFFDDLISRNTK